MNQFAELLVAFLTVAGSIFVAELTDKDAILLLTLATKGDSRRIFAAGAVAFAISSAIIVLIGSALLLFIPIAWIKVAGGLIMLGYAFYQYVRGLREDAKLEGKGESLAEGGAKDAWAAFFAILVSLILLDLAGDATEVLTIIFVAQYDNAILVFLGAVAALTGASAVEVALGSRLGRVLSARRIRYLSIGVFLLIGSLILLSTFFSI